MGQLYQQQAICLHQADLEDVRLLDPAGTQRERAKELIARSLVICRDQGVRWYPAGLNRAGRIFGHDDPKEGLEYLRNAIDQAKQLGDRWFHSASLIEYFEMCYRVWQEERDPYYRECIAERAAEIEESISRYPFIDLPARWQLLQGHLIVEDVLRGENEEQLDVAFEHYKSGLKTLAGGSVGSHGVAAIRNEFETLQGLYNRLPSDVRTSWYSGFRERWQRLPTEQSTLMLALLTRLQ